MALGLHRGKWHRTAAASLWILASLSVGGELSPLAAHNAQDWADMRAEMDAMRADVDAMKGRLDAQDAEIARLQAEADTANARADAAEAELAALEPKPPIQTTTETHITWEGAPEFSTPSGWSFKPRGRLHYDFGTVTAPAGLTGEPLGLGFGTELRRGRLGVEGDMPGGFGYRVEVDFANNNVLFADAFVTFKGGGMTITAGHHNNFQGLDELTSSNDNNFIERAAFSDAFGFERRVGLSAQYARGPILLQAGVFSDDISALAEDDDNSSSIDGRMVYAPKLGATQLHFGLSGHWRELGRDNNGVRYRQRPLVFFTDTRFIDTGVFSATNETSVGAEAAFVSRRWHGAAEAHWVTVSRGPIESPTFFGGAVEVGYFLTPHTRAYGAGIFRPTTIEDGVDKGGIGAVQIAARYDYLTLNDADAAILGGTQDAVMGSVIWTPMAHVRFMINYAHIRYKDAFYTIGTNRDYSVDVVGGRLQINF